jgi:ABC-type Zn2+ transport system substrate-binding protein/surface adhesin
MIKAKITPFGGYVMGSGDLPEGITEEQVMNKIMDEVYKKQEEIYLEQLGEEELNLVCLGKDYDDDDDDDDDYDDDVYDYDDDDDYDYDDDDDYDYDYDDEKDAGYQRDLDLERKEEVLWKDLVKEKIEATEMEVFDSMEDFLEL